MSEAPREWYSEEVKRLLGEIERLYAESDISDGLLADAKADNERLRAENESLRRALDVVPGKPTEKDIEWATRALEPKS